MYSSSGGQKYQKVTGKWWVFGVEKVSQWPALKSPFIIYYVALNSVRCGCSTCALEWKQPLLGGLSVTVSLSSWLRTFREEGCVN